MSGRDRTDGPSRRDRTDGRSRRDRTDGRSRLDEPLLRVDDVVAGYDATTVLEGVSIDVGDGEVVGLVGRNGVGKTTTLKTVAGLLQPTAGTVRYDGRDLTAAGPEATARAGIALVPEERRIFHGLSVRENLELARIGGNAGGGDRGTEPAWTTDAVLERFSNLGEREHASGGALSGGERQMLAIGRALVSDARTLLLDEPTEGLAPRIVDDVVETVEELRDDGLTILLVEQNVHVALEVCEYVYVMDSGEIVHEGSSEALADDGERLDRHLGVGP